MQPPARIRLRLNKNYQWKSTSSLFILVAIVLSRCCIQSFHKRCTEARKIKISAGNWERTYPKGFREDIPRTEKAGWVSCEREFWRASKAPRPITTGSARWCPMLQRSMGRSKIAIIHRISPKMIIRGWFASTFPCLMRSLVSWTRRFLVWQGLG